MPGLLQNAVRLAHVKQEFQVLMFRDASYLFWESCVTQLQKEGAERGEPVETMSHEPSDFLGDAFRGSQLNWHVVNKEGYAIVATLTRLYSPM